MCTNLHRFLDRPARIKTRKWAIILTLAIITSFLLLAVLLRQHKNDFIVASGLYACGRIDIYHNLVVWGAPVESDWFVPGWAMDEGLGIFAFDLEKKKVTPIKTDPYEVNATVLGRWIVWQHNFKDFVTTYCRDLQTGTDFFIRGGSENRSDQNFLMQHGFHEFYGYDPNIAGGRPPSFGYIVGAPAGSGNIVVWVREKCDSPYRGLFVYDLEKKEGFVVALRCAEGVAIDGNIAVWADGYSGEVHNIRGLDLNTRELFLISSNSVPSYPPSIAISGRWVVWADGRNPGKDNCDIYGYDLFTHQEFPICVEPHNQKQPDISGNLVVWMDERNGNRDIYGYDLETQKEFPVCTDKGEQTSPAIDGHTVVWSETRWNYCVQYTGRENWWRSFTGFDTESIRGRVLRP